jgi:site-specific DNA-methyltransferase (adenine-specific)/adenine-specific DNA-methyltransferase
MSNISDKQIGIINRYLKEGKPLPDRYRYVLFEDTREFELVWKGKGQTQDKTVSPFNIVEQSDTVEDFAEPSKPVSMPAESEIQPNTEWNNKLFWGDNKIVLSSLNNGPIREEIENHGGIKLIYIDPPFDVGIDYHVDIEVGDERVKKDPTVLAELAYSDKWGVGKYSFLNMLYDRLQLMYDLLSDDGSLFVHCYWRISGHVREILDEIFEPENFVNEIIWHYPDKIPSGVARLPQNHDTIFFYSKNKAIKQYNTLKVKRDKPIKLARKKWNPEIQRWRGYERDDNGKIIYDMAYEKIEDDVWRIPAAPVVRGKENLHYPTQKPKELLKRIIEMSSNRGDIVADFFCGSGTTLEVAERLGRKWIGNDLGRFAINTTRKRLLNVHNELKSKQTPFLTFDILKVNKSLQSSEKIPPKKSKDSKKKVQPKLGDIKYFDTVTAAYNAQKNVGKSSFYAKKEDHFVYIAEPYCVFTEKIFQELMDEARSSNISQIDILAYDFASNLFPKLNILAKRQDVDIFPKYIPEEIFDTPNFLSNTPYFNEVSYITLAPHLYDKSVCLELTGFFCFYNKVGLKNEQISKNNSIIRVNNGQIFKITKDQLGVEQEEKLTNFWYDWIDYWAVDFDVKLGNTTINVPPQIKAKQIRTDNYIFKNTWQSFRTKEERKLKMFSKIYRYPGSGTRTIAVKVVDVLGYETVSLVEVDIL